MTGSKTVLYQGSLLASSLKTPLTVQCASAENLERLVTALEFYLKTARGSAAPISAMPYLDQGVRLNNDGVVTALWAQSPMDKAGLKLGEILWSVGTNKDQQQRKADTESTLQALGPGTYNIYKTTPEDLEKAQEEVKANPAVILSPERQRLKLNL